MVVIFVKNTGKQRYYYTIHDYQPGLFASYTLTIIWGPYMETGRRKVYTFETRRKMDTKLRDLVKRRFKNGYTLFYSYSRDPRYRTLFGKYTVTGEVTGKEAATGQSSHTGKQETAEHWPGDDVNLREGNI